MPAPCLTRRWRPGRPLDVPAALAPHRRGGADPTMQRRGDTVWRTARPDGAPATIALTTDAALGEVRMRAWGPGAAAVLDLAPGWLGADDDAEGFVPVHPVLREAVRRHPGLVLGRTGLVLEALVPAVLEQKVTGIEAWRGWRALLRRHGTPAPGPGPVPGPPEGLLVVPEPAVLTRIPSWEWHTLGVGPQRAGTLTRLGPLASRLERLPGRTSERADAALRSVPGIGVWTSAEVRQRAMGDPDAVSVGDDGLPGAVTYALTGREDGTDATMLELLEPYRGHRHRACAYLLATGIRPPRRAPRAPIRDYRGI